MALQAVRLQAWLRSLQRDRWPLAFKACNIGFVPRCMVQIVFAQDVAIAWSMSKSRAAASI